MQFYKFLIKLIVVLFFSSSQAALLSGELDFSDKSKDHKNHLDQLIEKDINNLNTFQRNHIDDDSKKIDYIIPKNSAIVASNLMEIVLDPDRKYPMPITLVTELPVPTVFTSKLSPITQPLLDVSGVIIELGFESPKAVLMEAFVFPPLPI